MQCNFYLRDKKAGLNTRNADKICLDLLSRAIGIIRVDDIEKFKFITGESKIVPVMKLEGVLYVLVRR